MSDEGKAPSGGDQNAGGDNGKEGKDQVAYETYRKVLSEKKAKDAALEEAKAKLAEYEAKEKERAEAELKAKEDWKTMLALREKELAEAKGEAEKLKSERVQGMKLDAFLQTMQGKIEHKFWGFIDLEEVKVGPDGKIDQMSVTQAVENFKKQYPELIKTGAGPKTPAESPSGHEAISYEEWLKLPAKEMAKRAKDIINKI